MFRIGWIHASSQVRTDGRTSNPARLALGAVAIAAVLSPLQGMHASAQYQPVTFGPPVLLTTFGQCGGYEPTVVVDRFNNVVVTAHKQNHCLLAGFDPGGTLPARSQSWLWSSADGVQFGDMPGLTAVGVDRASNVGDEGDLVVDDAHNIYFVDTKVADNSFTSWHATGNNAVAETFQTPAMGTAQPSDDRPWITAHGNGVVAYFGNEGDKTSYSGQNGVGCAPPLPATNGRYTVYMSTNGGQTFDHLGCTLPDSGWCRPAADHTAGSPYLYAFCTNDGGVLYSFVSPDNGHTWNRYTVPGTYAAGDQGWPTETVDSAGNVYALYGNHTQLFMFRSIDHGVTWSRKDVTQGACAGSNSTYCYSYAWMAVAPDGSVGLAYYHTTDTGASPRWYIFAGTAPDWSSIGDGTATGFTMVSLAPSQPVADNGFTPWGDFFTIDFGQDNKLSVVWTTNAIVHGTTGSTLGLNSDIYYAVESGSLSPLTDSPSADVPETGALPLLAAVGVAAALITGGVRRRRRSIAR